MRPAMTPARGLALVAAGLGASGCGVLIDGIYVLGDGRYSSHTEEHAPTGQRRIAIEHLASPGPDGRLVLACARRTRPIERTWTVSREFRRRGGFDSGTYYGAAAVTTLIGGLIAVGTGAACRAEDSELSCWNMLYAAPFALDLGYSLIRGATARSAVLIDKQTGGEDLRFGAPEVDQAEPCDPALRVVLGAATGPSDAALLAGGGDGQVRAMADGALELPLDPGGAFDLGGTAGAVVAWAGSPWLGLWAIDGAGVPQPIEVDRCAALRPHLAQVSGDARTAFDRDCPLPQPTR